MRLLVISLSIVFFISACAEKEEEVQQITPEIKADLVGDSLATGILYEVEPLVSLVQEPETYQIDPNLDSSTFIYPDRQYFIELPNYEYQDSLLDIQEPEKLQSDPIVYEAIIPNVNKADGMQFMESAIFDVQFADTDQGLHSSYIWSIEEDSNGYLWIASNDAGVVRFDGQNYLHLNTEHGLCDNSIRAIAEDHRGNIWMASKGKGVSSYDGQSITTYRDSLPNSQIVSLFEDSKDRLWMGTEGSGVYLKSEEGFFHYGPDQGFPEVTVRSICEAKDGSIWFGTWGHSIISFSNGEFKHIFNSKGEPKGYIRDMHMTEDGRLCIATHFGEGVLIYDGYSFKQINSELGIPSNNINAIVEDVDGALWVGSNSGLTRITSLWLDNFSDKQGLRNPAVRTLENDSQGNVWVGSWGGGLYRIRSHSFEHFTTANGLPEKAISCFTQDYKGAYWVGTHRHGIAKIEDDKVTHYKQFNEFMGKLIISNKTIRNNVWFGTLHTGAIKLNGNQLSKYSTNQGLSAKGVLSIAEGPNGQVWFGTNGGGISGFKGDSVIVLKEEQGLSDDIVRAIDVDSKGNVWAGTWSEGLCGFDGSNVIYLAKTEGLASQRIYALLSDRSGRLWVGSDAGLDVFYADTAISGKPFNLKHFNESSGLSNNNVVSITEDNKGTVWVFTKKGINLFKDLANVSLSDIEEPEVLLKNDGLISSDFSVNNAIVDADNNLWGGSSRSLAKLPIYAHPDVAIPAQPVLQSLEINQEVINYLLPDKPNGVSYSSVVPFTSTPNELELEYFNDHLTFHFSSPELRNNHQLLYQYKLEGIDPQWSKPRQQGWAEYRNLSHGRYIFQIRSSLDGKHWSETTNYSFQIHPPWWKTWWAYTIFILAGAILIWSIYRWRIYKMKKRQVELEDTVEERTVQIRDEKQKVEQQKEIVDEKNREILDSIKYAKRIQNAILPPDKLVKEYLNNSFILYKPKDIVAGDFYWMESMDDAIYYAAADCTGHGVPGAMVSVICNNGLNRSLREYNLTDPGQILDKTRDIVISEFEKSEEEVKDGMDIALCKLEGNMVYFAGAYNPLWIIRDASKNLPKESKKIGVEVVDDLALIELKADKVPIGKFSTLVNFETHSLELEEGDTLYIFSDGYADQFGGTRGKKFKTGNFRKLLRSINQNSMSEQRELIDKAFEEWMGDLEQLDDVCVIGVKV